MVPAQHCASGRKFFPALPICPSCLEQCRERRDVTPAGTVHSFASFHRGF